MAKKKSKAKKISCHSKVTAARKRAETLRKKGRKIRVVKQKGGGACLFDYGARKKTRKRA